MGHAEEGIAARAGCGRPNIFGFAADARSLEGSPICYEGDAPTCVIAPTGSGKGRDFLIPNLLTYPGPIIAMDPKGELSAVCGRRAGVGADGPRLDPFGVTGRPGDRLNPFDQFTLPKTMLEPDSEMLASLLGEGHGSRGNRSGPTRPIA